ncbi:hypothetical protein EVAR_76629_1 [Eumeta japonica]|uniref:Uncharacterized protein n=1 Tax=Eumeta variegata TaxID=151549 RepID=A0A4C1T637_EUMVA|nr:hypothetical protein EVAR_76629_1 [Eumeta japonica]
MWLFVCCIERFYHLYQLPTLYIKAKLGTRGLSVRSQRAPLTLWIEVEFRETSAARARTFKFPPIKSLKFVRNIKDSAEASASAPQ